MTTGAFAFYSHKTDSGRWGRRNWIGGNLSRVDIWVLACPENLKPAASKALRASGFRISWFSQPQKPSSYQLRVTGRLSEGESITLARKLESLGLVFEIETLEGEQCLLMHHPGLGMKRVPLDASGEPVVRFGRLESLLAEARGNSAELSRLLRLEKGQAWFDLLEPYRGANMRVEGLLRAV